MNSTDVSTDTAHEVIVPAGALRRLVAYLASTASSPDTDRLMRDTGRDIGVAYGVAIRAALGVDPRLAEPAAFWATIADVFENMGWGRLEHLGRSGRFGFVEVGDWLEDTARSSRWVLTSALLEALLSDLIGRPVAVEDLGSVQTDRVTRRFVFGQDDAIGRVRERLDAGMEPSRALDES